MPNTTVTVARISNKSVTTKFGPKQTFSFQGTDDEWYSLGFKKPKFVVGDEVSFTYSDTTYGHQVDDTTVSVGGAEPKKGLSTMPATKPEFTGAKRMPSVFPIPALDGQRAIIRQNALTNAREVFEATGDVMSLIDNDGASLHEEAIKLTATAIIALAREFEAYTAGDIDVAMANEMMKEAK